jgi:hypothetical protein
MRETGGPDTRIITTGLTIVRVSAHRGAVMFALAEISRNAREPAAMRRAEAP